jgi:hypothetical protein
MRQCRSEKVWRAEDQPVPLDDSPRSPDEEVQDSVPSHQHHFHGTIPTSIVVVG